MRNDGFTLIELLMVLVIVAILAVIAIPSLLAQQERARDVAAMSRVRDASKGAMTFFVDQNRRMADPTAIYTTDGDPTLNETLNEHSAEVPRRALSAADTPGAGKFGRFYVEGGHFTDARNRYSRTILCTASDRRVYCAWLYDFAEDSPYLHVGALNQDGITQPDEAEMWRSWNGRPIFFWSRDRDISIRQLIDHPSGTVMHIQWPECVPRLRDQNMCRKWTTWP